MVKIAEANTIFFTDDLVKTLNHCLPNYQASLNELVKNGIELIGYARKSSTKDSIETRIRLLQSMVDKLIFNPAFTQILLRVSNVNSFQEKAVVSKKDISECRQLMSAFNHKSTYLPYRSTGFVKFSSDASHGIHSV